MQEKASTDKHYRVASMIKHDKKTFLLKKEDEFCTNQAALGWKQSF